MIQDRKKQMQADFKKKLGITVDMPKPGIINRKLDLFNDRNFVKY